MWKMLPYYNFFVLLYTAAWRLTCHKTESVEMMILFNYWQISEKKKLNTGSYWLQYVNNVFIQVFLPLRSFQQHRLPLTVGHLTTKCFPQVCEMKPFVITPESMALKSYASSRSNWAWFLRPIGVDHSLRALTDGEQHTDDPLSTRTMQPLSPEGDPFVQGETLENGSKGCRNDLEGRSRELSKAGSIFQRAQGRSARKDFPLLNATLKAAPVTSPTDEVSSPGNVCFSPKASSLLYLFTWSHLGYQFRSMSSKQIFYMQISKLTDLIEDFFSALAGEGQTVPCFVFPIARKKSVKVVCPESWTAVCEAVPLAHQMEEKTDVVLPHCVPVSFVSISHRIILRFTSTHAE